MVKVSVVIPVYNGQEFLNRCMDSVCQQTLQDIEIICVDDGSTDNTIEILEDYRQKDKRVQILRQQNQYAGIARNRGLKQAVGKYVIFWDSDDYFALDALQKLYECAEERDADICVCDAQDFDSETGSFLSHSYIRGPFPEKECFTASDMGERIYTFTSTVAWNKLIRRSLLVDNCIQFQGLQHINDVCAILLALSCAKRITLLKEKLIYYRMNRKDSLMGTYGDKGDSVFIAYETTKKELDERELLKNPAIRRSFQNKALGVYLYTMPYLNDYCQYNNFFLRMKEDSFHILEMEHLSEDEIYNKQHKLQYANIQCMEPADYLYRQYQWLSGNNNELKQKLGTVRQKSKEQKEGLLKLRSERTKLKQEIKTLKGEKKELRKQNKRLEKELNESKKECRKLRASWSYRIGSVIMWLPGKLKKLFLKNR